MYMGEVTYSGAGGSRSCWSLAEPNTASRHYGNTGELAASLLY
jgi:hypothetical protein